MKLNLQFITHPSGEERLVVIPESQFQMLKQAAATGVANQKDAKNTGALEIVKTQSLNRCADTAPERLADTNLSARQLEILNWAAQGKSNGDIAVILGQSKRAVDYHMSEILRKLKVSSRSQAIAFLSRV